MLNQLQKKGREEGFTLIELLVVVAIIGILAAIAIPQYASYKRTAVDAKMKSDLHNAATAMEAAYGDNGNTYAGVDLTSLTNSGYRQSADLTMAISAADATSYTLTATADGGSQANFSFNSDSGQIE